VLVIAGSRGMHGAAALCANAALRSGAGMVRAAVPAGIYRELSAHLLEIIGTPVGEDDARHFAPAHADELAPWIEWADVVVIGPGLGRHADTTAFLARVLESLRGKRVVVDGDGLSAFAEPAEGGAPGGEGFERFVLTPHAGEYRRMGGLAENASLALAENARAFAARRGLHLVLKGPTTLNARPDGSTVLSTSGNPGMATAGSGDVLAGILAALLTQKDAAEAAPLAVYLHGRAGEAARRDRGMRGMNASDLILYLPLALKELEDILAEMDEDDEEEN
jgi:hydroxyethylthiazole kinase-like uncharacterized protein yjeF